LERPAPVERSQAAPLPTAATITASPLDLAAAEMVDQQARIEAAVEALFGRLARDEALSANERLFLRQHAPPNATTSVHKFEAWLSSCTARVRAVLDLQAAAGSVADREQARQLEKTTAAKLATEGQQIEQQIAALQEQLATLAAAARKAQVAVERREQAVRDLQKDTLQPPRIKEQITVIYRANEIDRREFLRAESRLKSIVGLLALNPDVKEELERISDYAHGQQAFGGKRLSDTVFPRERVSPRDIALPEFKPDEWQRHLAVLRAEAAEHRATIARLEPINRRTAEEVRQLRCCLVPK